MWKPTTSHHVHSNKYNLIIFAPDAGLGITIAGYTCEREELSGIFVKSVTEGSAAHRLDSPLLLFVLLGSREDSTYLPSTFSIWTWRGAGVQIRCSHL